MYIPSVFRETRTERLHELIRKHSFGTLVSTHAGEMVASHLPFLLDMIPYLLVLVVLMLFGRVKGRVVPAGLKNVFEGTG